MPPLHYDWIQLDFLVSNKLLKLKVYLLVCDHHDTCGVYWAFMTDKIH